MIIYFVFFANFEMRRNLYGEKQTYTENYTNSFCKYNMSMNRDKHISVKGNFGIFLIKSKENYVFVLVGVGSTQIFLLENIGKYSLYLQHREKKDCKRGGMEALPTKTKHPWPSLLFREICSVEDTVQLSLEYMYILHRCRFVWPFMASRQSLGLSASLSLPTRPVILAVP
jgi:hypothetical protein